MAAKKENHPVYEQGVAAAALDLNAEACPYEGAFAGIWLDGFAGGDKKNATLAAEAAAED
jgi:hypothetical protein